MGEKAYIAIIFFLLSLVVGAVTYWRSRKDKQDDQQHGDLQKVEGEIYGHIDKQHGEVMRKLDKVLENQGSMDTKIEKSFIILEQHTNDLRRIGTKQESHSDKIAGLEKQQAVDAERWKRIMDKLDLK